MNNISDESITGIFQEKDIVRSVINFLLIDGYNVWIEAPNMGQSADVVAQKNRWLTFIEVKKYDWKRAIHQCISHEIIADYLCIAIGTKRISGYLENEIIKRGYGLIHFISTTNKCEWIRKPLYNRNKWLPQRNVFLNKPRNVNYEN